MIGPSPRCENIPPASTRALPPFTRSAFRIVSAAVTLVVSAALLVADEPERSAQSAASTGLAGVPGRVGPPSAARDRRSHPDSAEIVDLQKQVNELRSDLLDERERRIDRLQEANGAVLVVLGLLIGVGGLWAHAKFRSIASEARIGAAAARALATVEPNLTPQPSALSEESRVPTRPFPRLLRASVEGEVRPVPGRGGANGSTAGLWASSGLRASDEPVDEPGHNASSALRQHLDPTTPDLDLGADDADLQRYDEAVADCTEAIRLSPDDPRLYLERGNALSGLQRFEAAVADYGRAILLDPDNAAAYLARCHARSELGLHDEALEDYEHIVSLDPDLAESSRQE